LGPMQIRRLPLLPFYILLVGVFFGYWFKRYDIKIEKQAYQLAAKG
jgi:hypothetical protein